MGLGPYDALAKIENIDIDIDIGIDAEVHEESGTLIYAFIVGDEGNRSGVQGEVSSRVLPCADLPWVSNRRLRLDDYRMLDQPLQRELLDSPRWANVDSGVFMVLLLALLPTVLTGFAGRAYEVVWHNYPAVLLGPHGEATAAELTRRSETAIRLHPCDIRHDAAIGARFGNMGGYRQGRLPWSPYSSPRSWVCSAGPLSST